MVDFSFQHPAHLKVDVNIMPEESPCGVARASGQQKEKTCPTAEVDTRTGNNRQWSHRELLFHTEDQCGGESAAPRGPKLCYLVGACSLTATFQGCGW